MNRRQREILRSVSRSFYLSIRILPRDLRDSIGLAYLLARATDTIADTAELSAEVRGENLQILSNAIQGSSSAEGTARLRESFTPLQKNIAERALIQELPACLDWLERMPDSDRADIREVLVKINRGQSLDVERFQNTAEMHALKNDAELDEYTYLVAGCVGEFWTRVCFRHVRNFTRNAPSEMTELGKCYGMGLQLVNVIRDAGSDLWAGRCYYPADEVATQGITPEEILSEPERIEPVVRKWCDTARAGLAAGVDYSSAIDNFRVRLATVLPALIGARTLALLRAAGANALTSRVKVPRAEV
ncbi:MAG: phytoene/squalene synthase family protein, partial [Verrucomicrobiota bacterium]